MRKLLQGFIALTTIVAGCTHGSASARSHITELHGLEVDPGATKIDHFVADGRSGLVTEGWRDLGGGKGYRIYSIMVPNTNPVRGWDIVPVEPAPDEAGTTEATDIAGSVRFAHGYLDGTPTTFLITARHEPADGAKSGKIGFEIYRLVTARSGASENAFEPVLHRVSKSDFCSPDLALAREFDLKLPRGFIGVNNADGCTAASG